MTYTGASLVATTGQATSYQIQAWLEGNAAAGAAYVGLPETAIPASVGSAIVEYSRQWKINHDLLAALCAHESAWFQSKICRDKNNPGGYGAENDDPYNKAITFETMADGIRAVAAHLAGYVHGAGAWNTYSPRYPIVEKKGWAGSVTKLTDLNGKWAYPGTTYGQALARTANDLLATIQKDVPPMSGKRPKPEMIQKPSPNKDGYDTPRNIQLIVNHIGTSTADSNLGWLTNPASGASCNAYIRKDGRKYELVPITSSPWTNGVVNKPDMSNPIVAAAVRAGINPNTISYTIEHEGEPGDDLTPEQIKSNNEITAWVVSETGIQLNRQTFIGHYQIDSVNRPYCPAFSDTEWKQLLDGANALLTGGGPGQPPVPPPPPPAGALMVNGHPIVHGFRGLFETVGKAKFPDDPIAGAVSVFGFPLGPERATDFGSEQEFERVVLRYEKGVKPPFDLVVALRG